MSLSTETSQLFAPTTILHAHIMGRAELAASQNLSLLCYLGLEQQQL